MAAASCRLHSITTLHAAAQSISTNEALEELHVAVQPRESLTAASSITTPTTPVQLVAGTSSQPAHSSLACNGNMTL